jgi:predicted Zn-dependent peptidase
MKTTYAGSRFALGVILTTAMACGPTVIVAKPVPETTAPASQAVAVALTKPPTLAPPPRLALPPITRRELPNGLQLLVVEHHELPVADFALIVRSGHEADPTNHVGLASLTAAMLDEGTTTRSALQIADQLAFLGVRLETGAAWDMSTVSLHTPTAQLDSALALFADVVLNPAFPQAELERLRAERLTLLTQLKDRPTAIADQAFASIVFGSSHAYGRPTLGTEASVKQTSQGDIRGYYREHYRPNNATLIVVGDVRPDDIERRLASLLGPWPRRNIPAAVISKYPAGASAARATTVYLIDKPGAPQSSVRIGTIGVARSSPDYFPLLVMNTVLGVPFTSRLMQNLRETHGYTYGAGSLFDMRREAGPFTARAEVVATKTDSSLIEFMKELRAIRDTVPQAELQKAKRYLQLQLPSLFETTGDIAYQLTSLAVYDLPLDFYNSYVQAIERVTQADVQRVARKYINPDRMQVVVVGDRKQIEPGIRKLGLGGVEIRDITGAPVR